MCLKSEKQSDGSIVCLVDNSSVQEAQPGETADEVVQQPQEEVIDIDLNDPEVEKAAVKIQASFKGYHTRKEMQEHKEHEHVRGSLSPKKKMMYLTMH